MCRCEGKKKQFCKRDIAPFAEGAHYSHGFCAVKLENALFFFVFRWPDALSPLGQRNDHASQGSDLLVGQLGAMK